jgi:TolB-like protein
VGDRLNSWKEIAGYLNVSVRTAMRWEKTEGLPVHRHRHDRLSSVYAYKTELDRWWNSRPDLKQPRGIEPSPPPGPDQPPSIAVLPLANLSRGEEDEILCDGLTEELINALSQLEGLRVVARTSCFYFKGKATDIRTIGRRLGVGTVLEGSLRRSGNRLRIVAQLINAGDGCHLWSQHFDRHMQDLLEIEEEIARSIARALEVKLVGDMKDRILRRYGRDIEAYKLYLKGRYLLNRLAPETVLAAIGCFQQALARESKLAPAYTGLADCYTVLGLMGQLAWEEALRQGKAAAARALEIDSALAEAHASLGFLSSHYEYDWPGAEVEFRRAIELNPDYVYSHLWYAGMVMKQGRLDEAEAHLQRACQLDPVDPAVLSTVGALWLFRRQYGRSIETLNSALALDPALPLTNLGLGEVYLLEGRYEQAEAAFKRVNPPVAAAGFLGYCCAQTDRRGEAIALLGQLEELPPDLPPRAYQIAILHLGLGDHEAAIEWLDRSCNTRSFGIHWLKVDPIWDPLQPDPRFRPVLEKMYLGD